MAYRYVYMVYDTDDLTHQKIVSLMHKIEISALANADKYSNENTVPLAKNKGAALDAIKADVSIKNQLCKFYK